MDVEGSPIPLRMALTSALGVEAGGQLGGRTPALVVVVVATQTPHHGVPVGGGCSGQPADHFAVRIALESGLNRKREPVPVEE